MARENQPKALDLDRPFREGFVNTLESAISSERGRTTDQEPKPYLSGSQAHLPPVSESFIRMAKSIQARRFASFCRE
jgi:hypothetical protein